MVVITHERELAESLPRASSSATAVVELDTKRAA